jgi:chemotaxis protein methyltransferase CheR
MSAIPSKKLNAYVEIDLETLIKSVSKIVTDLSGIVLGPKQHHMVEGRLKSRMLKLGISSPQDYYSFLMNNKDSESQALLSLLTTHHTYFFREFAHFEFLESNFEDLINSIIKRGGKTLRILIAACSRGHESYSISIFLDYLLKKRNYPISYEIVAFDIDQESVAVAKNGVYDWKEIQSIPHHFLENNWKRGYW